MLKANLMMGMKSGHREYEYLAISGSPSDIASLISSLSAQLAAYVRDGGDRDRSEPRFEGTITNADKTETHLSGYLSVFINPDMRCAHPGCRATFSPKDGCFAAAFRQSGYVCEEHESEAKYVREQP